MTEEKRIAKIVEEEVQDDTFEESFDDDKDDDTFKDLNDEYESKEDELDDDDDELDDEDDEENEDDEAIEELYRENPLKAIWIISKEIKEDLYYLSDISDRLEVLENTLEKITNAIRKRR